MRLQVAQALVLDALYQVLDNKVFRVLTVVTGVLVLVPLLIAFREEEVVILFGFETYTYEGLFATLGQMLGYSQNEVSALSELELRELAIDGYQRILIDALVGTIGILLCLAATTFFVPRMIEKGTADTVFSKPVSRLSLLLARYFTGILFVGILSGFLVFGTHLTLLLASGYSDSAFLWTVPALIYKFGIVYAFTMLVAVVSRSTVTALILTIIFVPLNGCIHSGWSFEQMQQEVIAEQMGEGTDPVEASEERAEEMSESSLGRVFVLGLRTFRALHYMLPKTGDAMTIARKLRSSIAGESIVFRDAEVDFALLSLPDGFDVVPETARGPLEDFTPVVEGDRLFFAAGLGGTVDEAFLVIRKRAPLEIPVGKSGRTKTESSRLGIDLVEDWVEEDDAKTLVNEDTAVLADNTVWSRFARELTWIWDRNGEAWEVRTLVLKESDRILTFQLQAKSGYLEENEAVRRHFAGRDYKFEGQQVARVDADQWYAAKLDWTAPWRFNIFFSIGSSLGFAAIMILLAWARLARMDF